MILISPCRARVDRLVYKIGSSYLFCGRYIRHSSLKLVLVQYLLQTCSLFSLNRYNICSKCWNYNVEIRIINFENIKIEMLNKAFFFVELGTEQRKAGAGTPGCGARDAGRRRMGRWQAGLSGGRSSGSKLGVLFLHQNSMIRCSLRNLWFQR